MTELAPFYFAIVGTKDNPLYELESSAAATAEARQVNGDPRLGSTQSSSSEHRHLNQFIIHAALDVVDDVQWSTQNAYLKVVDRFNEWLISAYVLPTNIRFMLLHDSRNDDGIRQFFTECHENYIKILLNPFYEPNTPIQHAPFDAKVKAAARKFLH